MKSLHIALACFLAPILGWSQYGILDTTFNATGFLEFGTYGNGANYGMTVFQQADGGIMTAYTAAASVGIAYISPEGEQDLTFGGNYTLSAGTRVPCALLEQPDGKLMLVARGEVEHNAIRFIRHLANGQYDLSFGPNGAVTNMFPDVTAITVRAFQRLEDGRMLVAGTAASGVDRMFLARFLANGSPDVSFNSTGFRQYDVLDTSRTYDMEVRPDGRILLSGYAVAGPTRKLALLQVSTDGIPDATFGTNGIVITDLGFLGQELRAIVLRPDGSIRAVGWWIVQWMIKRLFWSGLQMPGYWIPPSLRMVGPPRIQASVWIPTMICSLRMMGCSWSPAPHSSTVGSGSLWRATTRMVLRKRASARTVPWSWSSPCTATPASVIV